MKRVKTKRSYVKPCVVCLDLQNDTSILAGSNANLDGYDEGEEQGAKPGTFFPEDDEEEIGLWEQPVQNLWE